MTKRKISIYLTEDEYETIKKFSESLNVSFTTAGTTAIKIGIASVNLVDSKKFMNYFEAHIEEIKNVVDL
jgi:flagellar basal body P-ring protein FlgI